MMLRFTLPREAFLEAVQKVASVVSVKAEMPILEHILIQAGDDGLLRLSGNNLDMEIQTVTEASVEACGETTVHAKKLHDILRRLRAGIDVEAVMEDGRLSLRCAGSRFHLATLDTRDYPSFEINGQTSTVHLPAAVLRELLSRTAYAMGRTDVRHYLNGVYLVIGDGKITSVATDGHRLAMKEAETGAVTADEYPAIIPRHSVLVLMRLLPGEGDVHLTLGSNAARFAFGEAVFSTKLIAARYPDWTRAIQGSLRGGVMIDSGALASAASRAAVLSDQYQALKIQVAAGDMHITATNQAAEEAVEILQCTLEHEDFQAELGLNAAYLADAAGLFEEDVQVQFIGDNYVTRIAAPEKSGEFHIIMPMRI